MGIFNRRSDERKMKDEGRLAQGNCG